MMLGTRWVLAGSLLAGCGERAEDLVYSSFREAAEETTPVVASTAARPAVVSPDPPGVLKVVFQLLRRYDPAADFDVDMTNLYRVLETADRAREITMRCVEGAPRPIAAPFPLGIDDTYTCAANNVMDEPTGAGAAAIRDEGSSHHALLTYRDSKAENTGLGVIQGHQDDVTGEVAVEMASVVRYPAVTPTTGLGFGLRTSIIGNKLTHDFVLRALVRDVDDPSDLLDTTSIVGSGNSQQEGGAFLLRITATGQNVVDGRYYCVAAGSDAAALGALDPAGTVDPAPACAALRARVDALTLFVRGDAPGELADFTGSDIYLPL